MLALTISLIIVIFALQNAGMVPIVFFNWSSEIPLVVVIFASVFAGAAIIFLLALWKDLKLKFTRVSSKATEYKGIMASKKEALSAKKDALSAKFDRNKSSTEDKPISIEQTEQAEQPSPSPVSMPDHPVNTKTPETVETAEPNQASCNNEQEKKDS